MPPIENWSCLPSLFHSRSTIKLIFIVNGEDVHIDAEVGKHINLARDAALIKSRNTGRPFEEWEIRDERGALLPPGTTSEEFDPALRPGTKLFLTLMAGVGGEKYRECERYRPDLAICLRCRSRFLTGDHTGNPAAE